MIYSVLGFKNYKKTCLSDQAGFICLKDRLVFVLVNQFVFSDPRHHGTQLRADFFDLVVGSQAAAGSHAGVVDGTFLDEHFSVFRRFGCV